MTPEPPAGPDRLARRLGPVDATVVGLGAMLGAGVFVVFAPAAAAAGGALLIAVLLAGLVGACNALSSARLAALYPESGGTYVYGRERLGPFWGYLAGGAFVVGKTASCAAMAMTIGSYLLPEGARWTAAAAVVLVTALNCWGVHRGAAVTAVVVVLVIAVLVAVVIAALSSGTSVGAPLVTTGATPTGVLTAAGFLFFAFAGYARIATLGEEVRDPARTIPRAIRAALAVTVLMYLALAAALLIVLGPAATAASTSPVADLAAAGGGWLRWPVRIAAVLAAGGALLALVLGVSRTVLALARDGRLPRGLAAVSSTDRTPVRAELAVGAVVLGLVLTVDLRAAIGFSAVTVLTYYLIANAAASTLPGSPTSKTIPVLGAAGCVLLAGSLPLGSLLPGLAVLAVIAGSWWLPEART
ncbi:APC family permease [Nakamurella alba]|uniref:APC family permease n=1 Tax=Nakamurella alba TaxID=2665158 RepID=UPI002AC34456|nr:APC family permease [Nakamurella alba]